jgi:hypothetical protein
METPSDKPRRRHLELDVSEALYAAIKALAAAHSARLGRAVSIRETVSEILCVAVPLSRALVAGAEPVQVSERGADDVEAGS